MRKTLLLACTLLAAFSPATAQPPAPDTSFLKLYCDTRGFLLGRPQKARLTPDGQAVLFLRSEAQKRSQSLFELDLASHQERLLVSPDQLLGSAGENLSPEEKARRERQRLQTGGFADFELDRAGERVLLPLSGQLYLLERKSGQVHKLKTGPSITDPHWSPDGKLVAYVRNQDVYLYDLASGQERALTSGGTLEVTHGVAEFVAQEEMGRLSGFWWSPDSRYIAYEEADHKGVEIWNIADPSRPDSEPQRQYYPRPGKPNVKVRLGILAVTGKAPPVWVEWDHQTYEYLAAVRWDPQGPLTVQLQDRKQQRLALCQADPRTGQTHRLLEQRDPTWVKLHQEVPVWLPGGKEFLMILEQEGFENLCLVRASDGQARRVVPPGDSRPAWDLAEFVSYEPGRRRIHCRVEQGPPGDPRELTVELPEDGSAAVIKAGDERAGVSELAVGRDGSRLVTLHTIDQMPRVLVLGPDGQERGEVPSVALEPQLALHYSHEPLRDEAGRLVLNTGLVRPRDFQPGQRYPVVLDVYGGPGHLQVVQSRRNLLVAQWLADQGFVVVQVDNRGTPGRGLAWEKAVYGHFGSVPMEDQIKGLQMLGKLHPELDLKRVGAVGWSFGGYMSALAVLKYPDVFAAAVAGAPVTDWLDYDTHYTERFLGVPPEAAAAYAEGSLLPLAGQLKRPLLLVHGTADDNVYFRHSLRLCEALFRAGRPFEMLPLPGMTHSYTADAQVTERLWARAAEFFRAHLGSPAP